MDNTSTIDMTESYIAHLRAAKFTPNAKAELLYHGFERRAADRFKQRPLLTTKVDDGTIAVWLLKH
jgi:hypothetical protein